MSALRWQRPRQRPFYCALPRAAHPPPRPLYHPPPAPSLSLVGIANDTHHARFAIELDEDERVLGWCTDRCCVYLQPGRYRVHVAASKDMLGGSRALTVDGPSLVTVSPQSHKSWAWPGVGLGSTALLIATPFVAYAVNHDTTSTGPQIRSSSALPS